MTRRGYMTGTAFVDYSVPEPRFATLSSANDGLALSSSYDRALVTELKARIPAEGRRWDPQAKVWLIDRKYGQVVVDLCRRYLGVEVELPAATKAKPKSESRLFKVEYLGATKDRGNGESSAYGYVDGGWNAVFPEEVLRQWFEGTVGMAERPDIGKTLYQQLGIHQDAVEADIRSAYRRLVRQWHPDVCHEPDAATVFKQIQAAYEVLADATKRRKYDAGLALQATLSRPSSGGDRALSYRWGGYWGGYRPLLRCGWILAEGTEVLGRFAVSKILQWEDVVDDHGRVMVTSWPVGAKTFEVQWR